ncbi:unnamed protein product [Trifolium pratense]|uniref:Uncharacterized protein n=1 Tax=Trifolium pratense TaxID=57577 RepID=A0ACB0L3K6_TRIPR|nr:unnamed protein product [Trifolium pratense]
MKKSYLLPNQGGSDKKQISFNFKQFISISDTVTGNHRGDIHLHYRDRFLRNETIEDERSPSTEWIELVQLRQRHCLRYKIPFEVLLLPFLPRRCYHISIQDVVSKADPLKSFPVIYATEDRYLTQHELLMCLCDNTGRNT